VHVNADVAADRRRRHDLVRLLLLGVRVAQPLSSAARSGRARHIGDVRRGRPHSRHRHPRSGRRLERRGARPLLYECTDEARTTAVGRSRDSRRGDECRRGKPRQQASDPVHPGNQSRRPPGDRDERLLGHDPRRDRGRFPVPPTSAARGTLRDRAHEPIAAHRP